MVSKFALLIAVVCGINACGQNAADRNSSGLSGKVYRHSMDGAPTNLDPVQAATVYSNFMVLNTYDTLYSYKYLARPYTIRPNLAVSLPDVSEDGLTYTIRLKKGVRFIDDQAFPEGKGRELVAEDMVYSLKRHFDSANRSQGNWLWSGRIVGMEAWAEAGADYAKPVAGLSAVDSHTLQIKLNAPYPQLVYTLAQGFAAVVPHEAVKKYGRELSIHPVGSGPYYLDRFDTAKAVLLPNPYFRKEPFSLKDEGYDPQTQSGYGLQALEGRTSPFVDRLEIDFISETAARWNSFTKGNETQFTSVPVEQTDAVLKSRKPLAVKVDWAERYNWTSGVEAGFVYTGFNMDHPEIGRNADPARDKRNKALRCAMRDAMDWDARNKRFYSGIADVFPGIVPRAASSLADELSRDSITHNLPRAKQTLKDAGWTPETLPEINYGFVNDVTSRQIFEQFRGFMADIGYPSAKLKPASYATFGDYNKAIKTSQLDLISLGWGMDYPDAENTLQLFYGPNHTPGSNNSNYVNPAFDSLYQRSSVMQDGPERHALYRQMSDLVIDDCVVMSGLSRNRIFLWHKNVIALPDREILGGFWLRYVDVTPPVAITE